MWSAGFLILYIYIIVHMKADSGLCIPLLVYVLYIRYYILYKVYGVDFGFIWIIYDFVIDDACVGL